MSDFICAMIGGVSWPTRDPLHQCKASATRCVRTVRLPWFISARATSNADEVGPRTSRLQPLPGLGLIDPRLPALCRYATHRGKDWLGDGQRLICGLCHPSARVSGSD